MNTTFAHQVVALSVIHAADLEHADWPLVLIGMGATVERQGLFRFRDGSAVVLSGKRKLPIEYIGGTSLNVLADGLPSYQLLGDDGRWTDVDAETYANSPDHVVGRIVAG